MSSNEESKFVDAAIQFTSQEEVSVMDSTRGTLGDSRLSFSLGLDCYCAQEDYAKADQRVSVAGWVVSERTKIAKNIWPICVSVPYKERGRAVVKVKFLNALGEFSCGDVWVSELNDTGNFKAAFGDMLAGGAQIRNCELLALALGAWIDNCKPPVFRDGERVTRRED